MSQRYAVETGQRADEDLDNVVDWYRQRHPSGIQRFLNDFAGMLTVLAEFPEIGRERPELRAQLRSYRVHPFIAYYVVEHPGKRVIVERILHSALDIDEEEFAT